MRLYDYNYPWSGLGRSCSVPRNPLNGQPCEVAYHFYCCDEGTVRYLEDLARKNNLKIFKSLGDIPERYEKNPYYRVTLYR